MTRNQIVELYSATFNRAADADGVAYWETQTNLTQEQMANSFVISAEAVALYPTTQTNTEYVTAIYNNLFGRAPEADGLAYWVGKLDDGTDKKESMIAAFINGASAADKAVLDNKTAVSIYAVEQGSNTTTVSLSSVTADAATVAAAKTAVNEANPDFGETFVLTTGVDTIVGTDKNDVITGVTSSLSSEKTLAPTDSIDGGAGTDTAKFSMKSDFTGFTGTNTMKNVETVELTNDSTIARTFDASGVTGVEKYKIDATKADIKLKDLNAAGITIDYSGAKAKAIDVKFDTAFAAAAGTADAMTLNVNGLGIDAVAKTDTKAAVALDALEVTMADIEELTINSNTNASVLDLAGVTAAKTITLAGNADTKITDVAATVATVDGTTATGKLNLDLKSATALNNVATGSADDSITIDAATLIANAQINGGAGEDTLVVTNSATTTAKTLQLSMSDIEKVSVSTLGTSNDVLLSNTNTSGLSTVDVTGALDAKLSLVNLAGADMTVNGKAASAAAGEVYLDNSGATTVNLSATAANVKAKAATTNDLKVTASETASLVVNVGEYVDSTSAISAEKATSVTVNVASGKDKTTPTPAEITKFDGTINAAKAETVTVNATGIIDATINAATATTANITTTAAASKLGLVASKLESLTITSGADLNFTNTATTASVLTAVQTLEANTAGALTLTALDKVSTASITGTATTSAATIASIGNSSLGYDTTLSATGLKAGLTVSGNIESGAGANTTVNVGTVTGDVDLAGALTAGSTLTVEANGLAGNMQLTGTLTGTDVVVNAKTALGNVSTDGTTALIASTAVVIAAKDSLIYNGTDLKANATLTTIDATSTTFNATLNGGIEADTHTITMGVAQTNVTVTGDLGLGTNGVTVTGVASNTAATATVDVSALKNSTTTIDLSSTDGATVFTVVGSDGVDTIKTGTKGDTVTAGKGADDITLTTTTIKDTVVIASGDTGATLATADTIVGFTTGTDVLKLGVAGTATNYATADVNAAGADTAANAAFDGTVMYFLASTGGTTASDSALYIDRDLDGTFDEIVELTGVLAAGFDATDIIA
ncbi:MAG: DUF4214 domain-containing protein [Tenuifilaceae bacterium]|nr:DUF4214 domain-containing protein [Tenuifilaceae bacterium]